MDTGAAPAMAQALRVLERMGAQNAQHDVVMDYKVGLGQGCLCIGVQSPLLTCQARVIDSDTTRASRAVTRMPDRAAPCRMMHSPCASYAVL